MPAAGKLTNYILIVNAVLYVAMMLFNNSNAIGGNIMDMNGITLFLFGAKEPSYIFHGEWWRLVTAGFLHGGIIHIAVNSYSLYNLGPQVEEMFGGGRMLVIYVLSSIAGFLASSLFLPSLSIGASAAICGLIGAMIAYGVNDRSSFGDYLTSNYAVSALSMLLLSSFVGNVDNWAHIGGLIGGFIVGYAGTHPAIYKPRQARYWDVAGLALVALVAISFAMQLFSSLSRIRGL